MSCYSVRVTGGRVVHFSPDVRHRMAADGPLCTAEPTGALHRHRPLVNAASTWRDHYVRGRALGAGTACDRRARTSSAARFPWFGSCASRFMRDRRHVYSQTDAGMLPGAQTIGYAMAVQVLCPDLPNGTLLAYVLTGRI